MTFINGWTVKKCNFPTKLTNDYTEIFPDIDLGSNTSFFLTDMCNITGSSNYGY